jgi:hypothetical protein
MTKLNVVLLAITAIILFKVFPMAVLYLYVYPEIGVKILAGAGVAVLFTFFSRVA